MTDIFKKDIETLVKLQEAETEIVRLKAVLEKVEKEKIKLSGKLKLFETALNANKEDLASVQKSCRDLETEIAMVDQRIIKSNEHLRMVKTNKEYQVLLREVDDNKKRKDSLETQLLEFFDEKDNAQDLVTQGEKEYALLKDQIESEQEKVEQKCVDDKQDLESYLAQQEDIGKYLKPILMNRFAKISKMNNGNAVVQVIDEVCNGCFMNIPPQLYIEVQKCTSLITCPLCSRIIYHQ
ncbi:MAG: C4-type zinc ribbon domain-containing protein [Desulfobacula sp.]|nr:C4-type zinc ribbon domain-containing protein [Desulfobacula sp.]